MISLLPLCDPPPSLCQVAEQLGEVYGHSGVCRAADAIWTDLEQHGIIRCNEGTSQERWEGKKGADKGGRRREGVIT